MNCKLLTIITLSYTPSCRVHKKEAELVKLTEENKQLKDKSDDLEKQIDTLEDRIDELLEQTVVGVTDVHVIRNHLIHYHRNKKMRINT